MTTAVQLEQAVLVELSDAQRGMLARDHPEVIGHGTVIAVSCRSDLRPQLKRAIEELVLAANEGRRIRAERLVEGLLPPMEVPTPSELEAARRHALLRTRLLQEFGAYTSKEVAALARSRAINRSQPAHRWKKTRRIFGVPHQGETLYLGFQFGPNGRPLPAMRDILGALDGWDDWDIAAWFAAKNDRLDRRSPVEVLADDPPAVVGAAWIAARSPRRGS